MEVTLQEAVDESSGVSKCLKGNFKGVRALNAHLAHKEFKENFLDKFFIELDVHAEEFNK